MRTRHWRRATAGLVASLLSLSAPALVLVPCNAIAQDQTSASSRAPRTQLVGVVNLNVATHEQLQLLPGIGPARATAILEYRKEHGAFKKVDDLTRVSGIGERALERIRPHCAVEGKTTAKLVR